MAGGAKYTLAPSSAPRSAPRGRADTALTIRSPPRDGRCRAPAPARALLATRSPRRSWRAGPRRADASARPAESRTRTNRGPSHDVHARSLYFMQCVGLECETPGCPAGGPFFLGLSLAAPSLPLDPRLLRNALRSALNMARVDDGAFGFSCTASLAAMLARSSTSWSTSSQRSSVKSQYASTCARRPDLCA